MKSDIIEVWSKSKTWFWFVLKAPNGEVIATSKMYRSDQTRTMNRTIERLRKRYDSDEAPLRVKYLKT